MKLGLYGGTFDPIHYAHLLLAEQCREQCGLDAVWFIPSGSPPHKRRPDLTPGKVRAEMIELAIAGHPEFRVDRRELDREGPSYTFETLEHLKIEDPSRELFFLIGADSLRDLPTWRNPTRIAELATIVAVNRGDRPLPDRDAVMSALGEIGARVQFVTMPGMDTSSTDLRRRVSESRSIRFMTPRAVETYIGQHGLYRGQS